MELFLASANPDEIRKAYAFPITGVLTNSTIIEREKLPLSQVVKKVDEIGNLQFGLQISSTEENEMMQEVRLFRQLVLNRTLHLKIPYCPDAFKVMNRVKNTGMILNLTAVSTLAQAVVALESCADYISIYIGRVTDAGGDGLKLLDEIIQYARRSGKRAKIVAASIRSMDHYNEVIKCGADAVAIPYSLLMQSLESDTTQIDRWVYAVVNNIPRSNMVSKISVLGSYVCQCRFVYHICPSRVKHHASKFDSGPGGKAATWRSVSVDWRRGRINRASRGDVILPTLPWILS
jgi:TalC/MipB family fructose-6-phosphate aldolase